MKVFADFMHAEAEGRVCNNLIDYLRAEIATRNGVIPFAQFMALALYHPEWGYYMSPDMRLGKAGDFTTAPEISPYFAKCIARACVAVLSAVSHGSILELGAGSGRFACDVLQELALLGCLPQHYFIYEISPSLRAQQQRFVLQHCPQYFSKCVWLETLPANFTGVVFANEVLDAMPVHRFHVAESNILEWGVTWEHDAFVWQLMPASAAGLVSQAQSLHDRYGFVTPYESEINLALPTFLATLSDACDTALVLFADYGYGESEYYTPLRQQGTLTAFRQHRRQDNLLQSPGQQDLTAHVNFTQVAECALSAGFDLTGYTSQAAFLMDCGLPDLLSATTTILDAAQQYTLQQQIKYLTLPSEMGERIKFMAFTKNLPTTHIPGFGLQDLRRKL